MPIKNHRKLITCSLAALALTLASSSEALAQTATEMTSPEDIGYDGDGEYEHQNRPLMYTGIGLTTTGLVGLAAGSAVVGAWIYDPNEFDDSDTAIVASSILIPSALLVSIGIPLWAVGAASPDPDVVGDEERSAAIPEFSIQGAGGSLRWRF